MRHCAGDENGYGAISGASARRFARVAIRSQWWGERDAPASGVTGGRVELNFDWNSGMEKVDTW